MKRTLYFAFGSNMDLEQMAQRCPSAQEVAPSVLGGYRFAYAGISASRGAGVATIARDSDSFVEGMLYSITEDDLLRLDGFEGAPHWYRRIKMNVAKWDVSLAEAWVYVLGQPLNVPTREYHQIIKTAYDNLGLDTSPLDEAIAEAREYVRLNGAPRRKVAKKRKAKRRSAAQLATRQMNFADWMKAFRRYN
jgi:gamma-glutamylcyclotransferase (GGCT)/AIG2-like uncharacterized protein YtfP